MDRALVYGTRGRTFESCRASQENTSDKIGDNLYNTVSEDHPWGILSYNPSYNRHPYERIFKQLEEHAIRNYGVRDQFKLAAGVVKKKQLITIGYNQLKSHPLQSQFGKNFDSVFLHAEIDAIRKSLRLLNTSELSDCVLYVLRVKRDPNGNWIRGMSKPCAGCYKAINNYGIKRVYYTTDGE